MIYKYRIYIRKQDLINIAISKVVLKIIWLIEKKNFPFLFIFFHLLLNIEIKFLIIHESIY